MRPCPATGAARSPARRCSPSPGTRWWRGSRDARAPAGSTHSCTASPVRQYVLTCQPMYAVPAASIATPGFGPGRRRLVSPAPGRPEADDQRSDDDALPARMAGPYPRRSATAPARLRSRQAVVCTSPTCGRRERRPRQAGRCRPRSDYHLAPIVPMV